MIPKPDQIVSAAANVAHKLLYGGLADLRPMPRTLIDDGVMREVYHYRPRAAGSRGREHGDPVLLVTPLAAPALCFDLRRGCSLVEHLVDAGRRTYLVEYGEVSFADRKLGMEHWVDEVIPAAIEEVSRHAGGRPVHLVGWSVGGTFALLTAADRPDLPIASLTTIGSPIDVTQVPMVAPIRPFLGLAGDRAGLVTQAYRLMGGAPKPLVRRAFQLTGFNKLVTKPIAIAAKLDDADFLAQVEAVDRFTANMIAYPGRTFGQLYHRILKGNQLASGTVTMDDRQIALADLRVPLMALGGASDGIAPVDCVRPIVDLVPHVEDLRFEVVPGGHLGMLTGRAARTTTWRLLDEWIAAHSSPEPEPATKKAAAKRAAAKKPAAKKATGKKATAKKAAAKKASTKRTGSGAGAAGTEDSIGTNPRRRYTSSGSRGLASRP
ncbi:alpha/beta fold hydrolase [Nocardioides mesophilus]|uniref:Alpha/beta fold hydrolase n=1 Tax=Nocardioides mesophilus TaxID=433659 RepID=A0A7G9RGX7_9ACTN|nr:alpha/beta fold hydrolase [Nocardioides mesophilus]